MDKFSSALQLPALGSGWAYVLLRMVHFITVLT